MVTVAREKPGGRKKSEPKGPLTLLVQRQLQVPGTASQCKIGLTGDSKQSRTTEKGEQRGPHFNCD